MTKDLEQLQSEWQELKTEVDQIQSIYAHLCHQRSNFQVQLIFPEGESAEALDAFHQQAEEQAAQLSISLKQLRQKLQVTRIRLKKKRAQLVIKQTQIYQQQARQLWPSVCQQAEEINQITAQLQEKIQTLKQTAQDFQSPAYRWLPHPPELVEISELNLPHLVCHENHWVNENQKIDWTHESSS